MLKVSPFRFFSSRRPAGRPKPKYFSLVDLGTDTIKVAVVEVSDGQVKVLGHSLTPANGRDIVGGRAQAAFLTSATNSALQQAEDITESLAGHKIVPDNVLFALPGRALRGKLFTVRQRRSDPTQTITQKELDALWDRILRLVRQGLLTLPGVGADWIPQTVTPAGLWLDNHLVNDPLGLQGADLSFSVYGTICQPAIVRGLEQLSERLEVDIYRLMPAPQALTTIIPTREALVLDVGASSTDCYLVRHDALVAFGHVPLGGNFFTRSMSSAFKCDFAAAETLKVAFASQVLSKADVSLVQRSLYRPLKRWAESVTETIDTMLASNGERYLPGQLFYVGGSAVLPGLRSELLCSLKEAGLTFERASEITNLGETPLKGFQHEPVGFRGILFALVLSLAKTI